jgi:hypothetical protein
VRDNRFEERAMTTISKLSFRGMLLTLLALFSALTSQSASASPASAECGAMMTKIRYNDVSKPSGGTFDTVNFTQARRGCVVVTVNLSQYVTGGDGNLDVFLGLDDQTTSPLPGAT